jgi:hypothetical protein
MKELSLNILDITKNSVSAGATQIGISIITNDNGWITIEIKDNGCGMDEEMLKNVMDPFCTTRTTRKVGMGIPLFKLAAEQTGGALSITSSTKKGSSGTTISATFNTNSIDFTPMGDIISTICILIAGSPEIDFDFVDHSHSHNVELHTSELREILGTDISLAEYEVQIWIKEFLTDQYSHNTQCVSND